MMNQIEKNKFGANRCAKCEGHFFRHLQKVFVADNAGQMWKVCSGESVIAQGIVGAVALAPGLNILTGIELFALGAFHILDVVFTV